MVELSQPTPSWGRLDVVTLSPCAVESHPTHGDSHGSSSPPRSISGVSTHVADGGSARITLECVLTWTYGQCELCAFYRIIASEVTKCSSKLCVCLRVRACVCMCASGLAYVGLRGENSILMHTYYCIYKNLPRNMSQPTPQHLSQPTPLMQAIL